MATSEERTLENALAVLLRALTYITANSVPVRNWDDEDDTRALPCVTVRVAPRERVSPSANFYRFPVDVVCYRHRGDDPNQAIQDSLCNEVADWAHSLTAAGLSVDGIIWNAGTEDLQDSVHSRGVSFDIFNTQ
jgi:hypothetical protein